MTSIATPKGKNIIRRIVSMFLMMTILLMPLAGYAETVNPPEGGDVGGGRVEDAGATGGDIATGSTTTGGSDTTGDTATNTGSSDTTGDTATTTGGGDTTGDTATNTGSSDTTGDTTINTGSSDTTGDTTITTGGSDTTGDTATNTGSSDTTGDTATNTGISDTTGDTATIIEDADIPGAALITEDATTIGGGITTEETDVVEQTVSTNETLQHDPENDSTGSNGAGDSTKTKSIATLVAEQMVQGTGAQGQEALNDSTIKNEPLLTEAGDQGTFENDSTTLLSTYSQGPDEGGEPSVGFAAAMMSVPLSLNETLDIMATSGMMPASTDIDLKETIVKSIVQSIDASTSLANLSVVVDLKGESYNNSEIELNQELLDEVKARSTHSNKNNFTFAGMILSVSSTGGSAAITSGHLSFANDGYADVTINLAGLDVGAKGTVSISGVEKAGYTGDASNSGINVLLTDIGSKAEVDMSATTTKNTVKVEGSKNTKPLEVKVQGNNQLLSSNRLHVSVSNDNAVEVKNTGATYITNVTTTTGKINVTNEDATYSAIVGGLSTGNGDVSITSKEQEVFVKAGLSGKKVTISSDKNVTMQGGSSITGTSTVSLTGSNIALRTGVGTIAGTTVTMTSTTGSIRGDDGLITASSGGVTLNAQTHIHGDALSIDAKSVTLNANQKGQSSGVGVKAKVSNTVNTAAVALKLGPITNLDKFDITSDTGLTLNDGVKAKILSISAMGALTIGSDSNTQLSGTNISLTSDAALTLRGQVTATDALTLSSGSGTTKINVGATATGKTVDIIATDGAISVDGGVASTNGDISLTAGKDTLTVNGTVSANGGNLTLTAEAGGATLTKGALTAASGDIEVVTKGGNLAAGSMEGNTVSLVSESSGNITLNRAITATDLVVNSAGSLSLAKDNPQNKATNISLTSAGNTIFSADVDIAGNLTSQAAGYSIGADRKLKAANISLTAISGNLVANQTSELLTTGNLDLTAKSGYVTLNNNLAGAANVTIDASTGVTLNDITASGDIKVANAGKTVNGKGTLKAENGTVTVQSGEAVTVTDILAQKIDLDSTTSLNVNGTVQNTVGDLVLDKAGRITVGAAGSIISAGDMVINAGGAVSVSGALNANNGLGALTLEGQSFDLRNTSSVKANSVSLSSTDGRGTVSTALTAEDDITVTTRGASSTLRIAAPLVSNKGEVLLTSETNITSTAAGTIQAMGITARGETGVSLQGITATSGDIVAQSAAGAVTLGKAVALNGKVLATGSTSAKVGGIEARSAIIDGGAGSAYLAGDSIISAGDLVLTGGNFRYYDSNITVAGNAIMTANGKGTNATYLDALNGVLDVAGDITMTSAEGALYLSTTRAGGNITLISAGNDVHVRRALTSGGTISINAGIDATFNRGGEVVDAKALHIVAGRDIISDMTLTAGAITMNAADSIGVRQKDALDSYIDNSTLDYMTVDTGSLTVGAGGDILINGIRSGGGPIAVAVTSPVGGNLSLNMNEDTTLGDAIVNGDLDVTTTGTLTTGNLTGNNVVLGATGGDMVLGKIVAQRDIQAIATGNLSYTNGMTAANIGLASLGGSITGNGVLTVLPAATGTITLLAPAGIVGEAKRYIQVNALKQNVVGLSKNGTETDVYIYFENEKPPVSPVAPANTTPEFLVQKPVRARGAANLLDIDEYDTPLAGLLYTPVMRFVATPSQPAAMDAISDAVQNNAKKILRQLMESPLFVDGFVLRFGDGQTEGACTLELVLGEAYNGKVLHVLQEKEDRLLLASYTVQNGTVTIEATQADWLILLQDWDALGLSLDDWSPLSDSILSGYLDQTLLEHTDLTQAYVDMLSDLYREVKTEDSTLALMDASTGTCFAGAPIEEAIAPRLVVATTGDTTALPLSEGEEIVATAAISLAESGQTIDQEGTVDLFFRLAHPITDGTTLWVQSAGEEWRQVSYIVQEQGSLMVSTDTLGLFVFTQR